VKHILLVDVDSHIPNLALMKLSTYHKQLGDQVEFKRLGLTGYPKRKKPIAVATDGFDQVYASMVFTLNRTLVQFEQHPELTIGGTGWDITSKLPQEIDNLPEDYSLYPENNASYGFITRGCNRKCSFCFVHPKEGALHFYRHPKDIIKHKVTFFLDNNFLDHPDHISLLEWLVESRKAVQFNQGLDFRLLTTHSIKLLTSLNYHEDYIFAFDHVSYLKAITEKMDLFQAELDKHWKTRMFILVGYNSSLADDLMRVHWCVKRKIFPYVMRHEKCYTSEHKNFYTDLAAWANQANLIKNVRFEDFLSKRCASGSIDPDRRDQHIMTYEKLRSTATFNLSAGVEMA